MSKHYTFKCENDVCEYKHGIKYNFEPVYQDDTCPLCNSKLLVCDYSEVNVPRNQSASIVSGVGDIESKNGGSSSDWNCLMRKIKKSNPNSTMRDY